MNLGLVSTSGFFSAELHHAWDWSKIFFLPSLMIFSLQQPQLVYSNTTASFFSLWFWLNWMTLKKASRWSLPSCLLGFYLPKIGFFSSLLLPCTFSFCVKSWLVNVISLPLSSTCFFYLVWSTVICVSSCNMNELSTFLSPYFIFTNELN